MTLFGCALDFVDRLSENIRGDLRPLRDCFTAVPIAGNSKVTSSETAHLRAETEFREGETP